MPPSTQSASSHPTGTASTFLFDRPGCLDPRCLERAVGQMVGRRPELAASEDRAVSRVGGRRSPPFAHLDLTAVRPPDRPAVIEAVRWVVSRCLERGRGAPLLVAYLDAGPGSEGLLLVAGRRPAVVSERSCTSLAEALLRQCGEGRPSACPVSRGRRHHPNG